MLPGLIVLVGVVVMYLLSRQRTGKDALPTPGYFHVLGIDKTSGERRESTFHAASEDAARGRAELEGIVVTEIRLVNERDGK